VLKVNEYFNGKVKSVGFMNEEGHATVGVMEVGEYEFSTSTIEYMTIISGSMSIMLPGSDEWRLVGKGETFSVCANCKFKLNVLEQTAYCCFYI